MVPKIVTRTLFICTGNYYRSRFAEIIYNDIAEKENLDTISFSLGLEVFKSNNKGTISPHIDKYLSGKGVKFESDFRWPIQIQKTDFEITNNIIAMDKTEHQPMMEKYFPGFSDKIKYWSFPDDYIQPPEEVLPQLEMEVRKLIEVMFSLDLKLSHRQTTPETDKKKA